jgi:hypothetical protein
VTPPGIDPETVRLVAQCLNHYATPGPRGYYQDQYNVAVCIWVTRSSYLKPSVDGASKKSVACILSNLTSLQSCCERLYFYTEGFMVLGRRERRYYCYNGTTELLLWLVRATKLEALQSLPPLHYPSCRFRPM